MSVPPSAPERSSRSMATGRRTPVEQHERLVPEGSRADHPIRPDPPGPRGLDGYVLRFSCLRSREGTPRELHGARDVRATVAIEGAVAALVVGIALEVVLLAGVAEARV